jgi:hypothetical protein
MPSFDEEEDPENLCLFRNEHLEYDKWEWK